MYCPVCAVSFNIDVAWRTAFHSPVELGTVTSPRMYEIIKPRTKVYRNVKHCRSKSKYGFFIAVLYMFIDIPKNVVFTYNLLEYV